MQSEKITSKNFKNTNTENNSGGNSSYRSSEIKTNGVKVTEYRKLLEDYKTPDEKIVKKIEYLEALCRNIIRDELKKYGTIRNTSK